MHAVDQPFPHQNHWHNTWSLRWEMPSTKISVQYSYIIPKNCPNIPAFFSILHCVYCSQNYAGIIRPSLSDMQFFAGHSSIPELEKTRNNFPGRTRTCNLYRFRGVTISMHGRVGRIMLKKSPIILFLYSHKTDLLFPSDCLLFSHYSH